MLVTPEDGHFESEFLSVIAALLWLQALHYCSARHDLSLSSANYTSTLESGTFSCISPDALTSPRCSA
jgi:hypothetical protein